MKNKWFSTTEIGEIKRTRDNRENLQSEEMSHRLDQSPLECKDEQEAETQVEDKNLSNSQEELLTKIKNNMIPIEGRTSLPSLKNVNRKKLAENVQMINELLQYLPTDTITETNTLMYAAAKTTTELMGQKPKSNAARTRKEPAWKMRLTKKLTKLRKDLSLLADMKKGKLVRRKKGKK